MRFDADRSFRRQLAETYGHLKDARSGDFKVEVFDLPAQKDDKDCGLFAIAYITEILTGGNPERKQYKQRELRGHLIEIMESTCLSKFQSISTKKVKSKIIMLSAYCCYMKRGNSLVGCSKGCENGWFHEECLGNDVDRQELICDACSSNHH